MALSMKTLSGSIMYNPRGIARKIWEAVNDVAQADPDHIVVGLSTGAIGSGSATDPQFDGGSSFEDRSIKIGFKPFQSGHNTFWTRFVVSSVSGSYYVLKMYAGSGPGAPGSNTLDDEQVVAYPRASGGGSGGSFSSAYIIMTSRGFLFFTNKPPSNAMVLYAVDRGRYFNGAEANKLIFSYAANNVSGINTSIYDVDGSVTSEDIASRSFSISGLSSRGYPLFFGKYDNYSNSPGYKLARSDNAPVYDNGTKKLVMGPYPNPDEVYAPHSTWFLIPDLVDGIINVQVSPTEVAQYNVFPLYAGWSGSIRIAIRVG